jgi:hypothetical protein
MESQDHSKYDHEFVRHDPGEGYDHTEPDAKSITGFVIASIIVLVGMIAALQFYFEGVWNRLVYQNVLSVPSGELADQHNLEDWRLTHYEYTDKSKTTVRIPLDQAKKLFLEEAKAGKTFYPGKPTEPKPETPADSKSDGKPADSKAEAKK